MARKPVHLVFVEEKSVDGVDHNKFYDFFERNGELHVYWGRRQDGYEFGKSGKVTIYDLSEWDKLYKAKIKKGYEDKSHHYEEVIVATTASKSGDLYAPIPDKEIAKIVERLQAYAKEVIAANYSVTAGQVTKVMVDETQHHLDMMMNVRNITEFNMHLKEIFKIIPRSMKRVDAFLAVTPNEMAEIISREQDLLDIMRGQVISPVRGQKVETATGDKKTILELNGIEMEPITAADKELILKKLGSNASMFKNAWRVKNVQQKKNYDKFCKEEEIYKRDTKLLWHGTRNPNVWNILKTGLMIRPTVNVQRAGSMFGQGLYFAPLAQKSVGYTSLSGSYWAKGNENTAFMILHEVAYGKPYDVYSFDSKFYDFDYRRLRNACPGAHCLHAHASPGMLRNDEIIVYKEEQLSPLFLVEIGH